VSQAGYGPARRSFIYFFKETKATFHFWLIHFLYFAPCQPVCVGVAMTTGVRGCFWLVQVTKPCSDLSTKHEVCLSQKRWNNGTCFCCSGDVLHYKNSLHLELWRDLVQLTRFNLAYVLCENVFSDYYFNAAHKTQKDLLAHSESMVSGYQLVLENLIYVLRKLCFFKTTVNNARLTDEKKMKEQLSEEDDLFHWIKHQATKGVFSAQVTYRYKYVNNHFL